MAELTFHVKENDTAVAVGSGDLAVLATPRLIGWLEAACLKASKEGLANGYTTVGYRVDVAHLRPAVVGETITVRAVTATDDGQRIAYRVSAYNARGELVAQGEMKRSRVEAAAFMDQLER